MPSLYLYLSVTMETLIITNQMNKYFALKSFVAFNLIIKMSLIRDQSIEDREKTQKKFIK